MRRSSVGSGESGSAIVEFALVAPLFILVLFAAIQISIVLLVQNALDTAAREASRVGITGQTQSGETRSQHLNSVIVNTLRIYSGGFIKPGDVKILVKSYADLSDVNNPEPFVDTNGDGKYDPGEPFTDVNGNGVWDADQGVTGSFGLSGQVVEYDISYTWDTVFPIFGRSSQITLHGITPVVNEDY